jgi:histidinol-phosphatase
VSVDLDFALALADTADAISLPRFRAVDLRVETKPDLTPVTDADRAVERALREQIGRERPGEGVLGEEEGGSGGPILWVVDPIDGTKNFSRGIPVWATLIALERDGEIVCGVASAPALGHRWWAARGAGAYRDGERLHVSKIDALANATVSFSRSGLHDPRTIELALAAWHAQPFSDFWAHLLVAEGAVEVAVEHTMSPWDNAVLQVVVEEAGGRFTSLDGEARYDGGSAVSTNGLLHDDVLAWLGQRGGDAP